MSFSTVGKSILPKLGLAAALLAPAVAATAGEQRCQELGQTCICSEPLNSRDYRAGHGPNMWIDPDDSEDATECKGEPNDGSSWYPGNLVTVVPESGMPAGNQVDWVWRADSPDDRTNFIFGEKTIDPSTKRLCGRHYVSYDPQQNLGACYNKVMDIKWGPGQVILTQTPNFLIWVAGHSNGNGPNLYPTGTLTPNDCKSPDWCRVEMCVSGDSVLHANNLSVDGYVENVKSGERVTWAPVHIGSMPSDGSLEWLWLVNAYRHGGGCPGGNRSVSHVMQAEWTSNQGQYIGPAYEIEGGGGGASDGSDGGDDAQLGRPGRPYLVR